MLGSVRSVILLQTSFAFARLGAKMKNFDLKKKSSEQVDAQKEQKLSRNISFFV